MTVDKQISFARSSAAVIKRFLESPGVAYIAVLTWKVLLFLFWTLPVPSNDSFFYDGAAVNRVLHGSFVNPSLAIALPISGQQLFSAYPPVYPWSMTAWMSIVGTGARAAMFLHLVLFAGYMAVLFATLKRLNIGPAAMVVSALFLPAITFHDRPDSLAHLFGLLAIYSSVRYAHANGSPNNVWAWLSSACLVLCLFTGLQLGTLYYFAIWSFLAALHFNGVRRLPLAAMLSSALTPVAILVLIVNAFPLAWSGFVEHARLTPAITGIRAPGPDEIIKAVRNAPGILVAASMVAALFVRHRSLVSKHAAPLLTLATLAACLAVLGAALTFVTPNAVSFVLYLQPLVAAGLLSLIPETRQSRIALPLLCLAAAMTWVRAAGLTTWGLLAARDCGYRKTMQLVRQEIRNSPPEDELVFSSAYLYEAFWLRPMGNLHCDWLAKPGGDQLTSDMAGFLANRPQKLILTQFDYYRRFERLLSHLQEQEKGVVVQVRNAARVRAPDSFPSLRRVVQHISWAPVVVEISWPERSSLLPVASVEATR